MPYQGLINFISTLESSGELQRIKLFVDPVLEIAEITDRITKNEGKALLFENTGTDFPLLINAFGSDKRMAMAIGQTDLSEAGKEVENYFNLLTSPRKGLAGKLKMIPRLFEAAKLLPEKTRSKGRCQEIIDNNPDLSVLPVLKCWPNDGGRFITLPIVHTIHPVTEKTNVGMYRMQIMGKDITGMHWQRHKTGANHYEAWKKEGKRMPVSVTLGGDPVYTYCATAPLPENISEYILAGFLRKKRVKLVKCITNDLYIPADADIVLEGFVDPSEELVMEGPFGDHTGFYSLADMYPVFHVTCITYSHDAVYPATIVGIPPQEDAWLTKASERIFLAPMKIAIQPEVMDFHMPEPGVAHNLVVVKINKTYPGQGLKVISSLFGAGQMMFTKYIVVVSGDVDIRDYKTLVKHVFLNIDPESDIVFNRGPLDVLDHSSDTFSFGGKAGIDATGKLPEELTVRRKSAIEPSPSAVNEMMDAYNVSFIKGSRLHSVEGTPGILILAVNPSEDNLSISKAFELLKSNDREGIFRLAIAVDHTVSTDDLYTIAWQTLGNADPARDHYFLPSGSIFLDATIKFYRKDGFPRRWPNVVCSDKATIEKVDKMWSGLGIGSFIKSPSLKYLELKRGDGDSLTEKK